MNFYSILGNPVQSWGQNSKIDRYRDSSSLTLNSTTLQKNSSEASDLNQSQNRRNLIRTLLLNVTTRIDGEDPTLWYANATVENGFNQRIAESNSPYFIVNSFMILLIHILAWIISSVLNCYAQKNPEIKIIWTLRNIFHHSVPIFIYFVTSSDFFLFFLYQMQYGNFISQINQISVFTAGFTLLYWMGVFVWLFISINFGNIFEREQNKLKFLIISKYFKND